MTLETVETEKNLLVENIVQKFSDLLALANTEEVMALDKALAQVMPALPNEYLDFKIGWMHTENNNVECGIALFIRPVLKSSSLENTAMKFFSIITHAKNEDLELLNMAMDTIMECNAKHITINTLPVMEIVPHTWAFHFSLNTKNNQ